MQPGGYQVVTGLPFMVIEDAPLVHGGPVCVDPEPIPHSITSPSVVSNAILFTETPKYQAPETLVFSPHRDCGNCHLEASGSEVNNPLRPGA
jgi:hypothetical protein